MPANSKAASTPESCSLVGLTLVTQLNRGLGDFLWQRRCLASELIVVLSIPRYLAILVNAGFYDRTRIAVDPGCHPTPSDIPYEKMSQ